MKIGELAKLAGCPVETIRYYEREGLLLSPVRDIVNNYRSYEQVHQERLTFIRRCRALDMTHGEIRALLQAREQPDASCASINELIDDHLNHVQARLADLQALQTQLVALRNQCQTAESTRDCGILHELGQPSDALWRSADAQSTHVGTTHSVDSHGHIAKPA